MTRLPTGIVTFLFTDIEGSTAFWELDRVWMQAALVRHDEIMRSAIGACDGHVFKTIGDAFCAAFTDPSYALGAALAAQRAMRAEGWGEKRHLRVRMALHTGAAEERASDYFGLPLNRVQRLVSAGHGGQILLSAVTYGLVRDYLEPGVELRDLGEHRLKDLRHPERIFQLVVPDLPADFSDLITLDAPSDNGRYRRTEFLGSGGMAEVYLAYDAKLQRSVALKVLSRRYAGDEEFIERFEREAVNAASFSHPNIVTIHDWGKEQDGTYYIVMEYVTGGTLKRRIIEEAPFPPEEAVRVALQIARALQTAHGHGMIHRDVKPQNVLLTESDDAKVADFGIARALYSSTMTQPGDVLGTPHYMSPEQAAGRSVGPKSDLYSLGVVLCEMLTGMPPHEYEDPVGVVAERAKGRSYRGGETASGLSEGIAAITARLLAKDPAERYPDATELIGDLEQVNEGDTAATWAATKGRETEGSSPIPHRRGRRRGTLPWVVAAALLVSVLVGILGWSSCSGTGREVVELPNVEGEAREEAEDVVRSAGFILEVKTRSSQRGDEGLVVEQSPPGGEQEEGSGVTLVIGAGPSTVAVPDLAGRTVSEVDDALDSVGLKLAVHQYPPDDVVTGQNPPSGTEAEPGSSVSVVAVPDSEEVAVPEVSGRSINEARRILSDAGLGVAASRLSESPAPSGTVVATIPAAGSMVEPQTVVTPVVSSRPRVTGGG